MYKMVMYDDVFNYYILYLKLILIIKLLFYLILSDKILFCVSVHNTWVGGFRNDVCRYELFLKMKR